MQLSRPLLLGSQGIIGKVLIKAACKMAKRDKLFTLHNLNINEVNSHHQLKKAIRSQLHADIISTDFDVGFIQGGNTVSIRNMKKKYKM